MDGAGTTAGFVTAGPWAPGRSITAARALPCGLPVALAGPLAAGPGGTAAGRAADGRGVLGAVRPEIDAARQSA